ncbi:MAG: AMP nucleosidase [Alphaproteobacteria bacterium]|nr:AMP nucleosidase [Alphaproteobacteria bacterium]
MSELKPFRPTPDHRRLFYNADEAFAYVKEIYDTNAGYLRENFNEFTRGKVTEGRITANYPYIAITTVHAEKVDSRLSFGFVQGAGTFRISLTRPDIFEEYYKTQFALLLRNHKQPLEVGVAQERMPVHFAFAEGMHLEEGLTPEIVQQIRNHFDMPNLADMDDSIVNGTFGTFSDGARPLALFTAPRVDYSLHRLRHYTGTNPAHFQKFVIFTNYQFYMDEFVRMAQSILSKTDNPEELAYRKHYLSLMEPGGRITHNANLAIKGPEIAPHEIQSGARMPQMPAYHLVREGNNGVTVVNIGIGPSNAKNISDHIAVLRPHAWMMLGHCAGLHDTQRLGDYVLAHAYVRDDNVLNRDLPQWVPVPALAEMQKAMEQAVAAITGKTGGYDVKSVMRTGTVVTVDNRNWEITGHHKLMERFSKSRAIALDMESATIAANGFRFRVPYGTLLCVSDKPLHGEIKLPGMANKFYKDQVDQHLKIGMLAMELLREQGVENLHSRKLRSFCESAFQ